MKWMICLSLGLTLFLSACATPRNARLVSPYHLAAFSQNYVSVDINLQQDPSQKIYLSATFTPDKGYHLYSKDIPREGVYGQSRPTLMELTPQSQMRSIGGLTASVADEVSSMGTDRLLVYPAGPVTLRLQVTLPPGTGRYADQLSVTYEACSQTTCLTPVIERMVKVKVPGSGNFQP
jgi:hypothetical protein